MEHPVGCSGSPVTHRESEAELKSPFVLSGLRKNPVPTPSFSCPMDWRKTPSSSRHSRTFPVGPHACFFKVGVVGNYASVTQHSQESSCHPLPTQPRLRSCFLINPELLGGEKGSDPTCPGFCF